MATVIRGAKKLQRGKYPWAKWTDGNEWVAKQGDDFSKAAAFRWSLYQCAYRKGLRVVVKHSKDNPKVVRFQFSKPVTLKRRRA